MTQQNILELARAGDANAIASLMNRQLQFKGITTKATLSGNCLTIVAESKLLPEQAFLVDFIRKGMTSLRVETIKQVVIKGQAIGQTTCTWQEAFELHSGVPVEQVQLSSSKNIRTSTTEKTSASQPKTKSEGFSKVLNQMQNRNVERVILVVGASLVTSCIWVAVGALKPVKVAESSPQFQQTISPVPVIPAASASPTSDPAAESARDFIEKYINDIINKGDSGSVYWCSESKDLESSFFAPRSARILDILASETSGSVTIQLDSSNKGGGQITNNWSIFLKKETDASKANVLPGGWCIALISEKS